MDATTITGTTFTLRAQGAGSDVPATVSYSAGTATLDPAASLAANTVYTATVKGTVTDTSGNALGSDSTWTFTTAAGALLAHGHDRGRLLGRDPGASDVRLRTTGGEVDPHADRGSEFSGSSLPSGWTSTPWAPVGPPPWRVDPSALTGRVPTPTAAPAFGPGRSIEFVATFGAATFQTVGFGDTLAAATEQWVQFGTANSSTTLFARTSTGNNNPVDVSLGTTWIGSPHRYRIDWTASQVVFSIDGTVVNTANVAVTGNLRPVVSDFTVGGPSVSVDWLRMTPYAATGTFTSRVLDGHSASTWAALTGRQRPRQAPASR